MDLSKTKDPNRRYLIERFVVAGLRDPSTAVELIPAPLQGRIISKIRSPDARKLAYKPEVLYCFPSNDEEAGTTQKALIQNVPMFILPLGAQIEKSPPESKARAKSFSACVLTDKNGTKYYVASLMYYEKIDKEALSRKQLERLEESIGRSSAGNFGGSRYTRARATVGLEDAYFWSKAMCLVSRYPFFNCFQKFLFFLHEEAIAEKSIPDEGLMQRCVYQLMFDAPFPSSSRCTLVHIAAETLLFESPDDRQMPLTGACFVSALKKLRPDNFIFAMLLVLLEQKILLHSHKSLALTEVAETLTAAIFPFFWQCPYIPNCPLDLAKVIHAPMPFIIGISTRVYESQDEIPQDVTVFDLDSQTECRSAVRKYLKTSVLPKKPLKQLRATLEDVYEQMGQEFTNVRGMGLSLEEAERRVRHKQRKWNRKMREAFLRFMCSLMAGYSDHLLPIAEEEQQEEEEEGEDGKSEAGGSKLEGEQEQNHSAGSMFNWDGFLRTRDRASLDFYKRFCDTQSFIRFIEERAFVVDGTKSAHNVFFDDCLAKLELEKTMNTEIRLLGKEYSTPKRKD